MPQVPTPVPPAPRPSGKTYRLIPTISLAGYEPPRETRAALEAIWARPLAETARTTARGLER